jgi:hypothetical protein
LHFFGSTTRLRLIPKVCGGEKETKEQSNSVSENLMAINAFHVTRDL